jgi:hypothetical protein
VLDQIGSAVTIEAVVRVTATLWALPATLLTIAGYRSVADQPPAPLVATYLNVSRASVALLSAFTLLIAGLWLVRSGRDLRLRGGRSVRIGWPAHLSPALLGAVTLAVAFGSDDPTLTAVASLVAAMSWLVAGLVLPRWLLSIARSGDRAVVGWAVLSGVMVFELTLGWWHSATLVNGAPVVSAWLALGRGLLLCAAVVAVIAWSRSASGA